MDQEKFVKQYIDRARKNEEVELEFRDLDENKTREARAQLESFLAYAYDEDAKNYFEKDPLGRYVSTFLRAKGGVMDGLGSYFFWAAGGSGLGLKAIGLLEKTLADRIDSKRVKKYVDVDLSDKVKLGAETVAERAAAYLPLFAGEIADLLRGRSKHDNLVLEYTAEKGVNRFLDYRRRLKENPDKVNVVPVEYFRNPAYAEETKGAEEKHGPKIVKIGDVRKAEEEPGPATIKINDYKASGKRKTG